MSAGTFMSDGKDARMERVVDNSFVNIRDPGYYHLSIMTSGMTDRYPGTLEYQETTDPHSGSVAHRSVLIPR